MPIATSFLRTVKVLFRLPLTAATLVSAATISRRLPIRTREGTVERTPGRHSKGSGPSMAARRIAVLAAVLLFGLSLGLQAQDGIAATVTQRGARALSGSPPDDTVKVCPSDALSCSIEESGPHGTGAVSYAEDWDSGQYTGADVTVAALAPEPTAADDSTPYGLGFYYVSFSVLEETEYSIEFQLEHQGNFDNTGSSVILMSLNAGGGYPFKYARRGSTVIGSEGAPSGVLPSGQYQFGVSTNVSTSWYDSWTAGSSSNLSATLVLSPEQCPAPSAARLANDVGAVTNALCSDEAVIDTTDGETAMDVRTPSILELKSLPGGIGCATTRAESPACTYEWLRSSTQSDGNYVATSDGTIPADERHRLDQNGLDDVGHWFVLEVTDPEGNTALSNPIGVGPSERPELGHPNEAEEIRVQRPHFNVKNVTHDRHAPPNEAGSYKYEFQASSDSKFPEESTVTFSDSEQADNHGVSYAQATSNLANGTVYWRARAVMGDAPGRWSDVRTFTVGNTWSDGGGDWHSPLDATTRIAGTHREPYFHTGYMGTKLHGGLDFAACDVPVRAALSGRLSRRAAGGAATVSLLHPSVGRQTQYLHMKDIVPLTTLPLGTFINQGTRLGTASDVGIAGSCHLHFDVANMTTPEPTEYFNPLEVLPASAWENTGDPTVGSILLRSVEDDTTALIESGGGSNPSSTGIADEVYVIAGTNDPNPTQAPGRNLTPERAEFWINGVLAHTVDLNTSLTNAQHERDYFARRSARARAADRAPASSAGAVYFFYYKWNTDGLAADAGPQEIEVRAFDHAGNSGTRTMTIGPSIIEPIAAVCGGTAQTITLQVENRNANLEALAGTFARNGDRYDIEVAGDGVGARRLGGGRLTVAGSGTGSIRLRVDALGPGVDTSTVTVRVRSGILSDVSDSVTLDVRRDCL